MRRLFFMCLAFRHAKKDDCFIPCSPYCDNGLAGGNTAFCRKM
jgi:hypothetical protein